MRVELTGLFVLSGTGTVDFKEFVKGLSAFSNQGSSDEKLKCAFDGCDIVRLSMCPQTDLIHIARQSLSRYTTWTGTGTFRTASCSSS